jgi:hypothetical protein
MFEKSIAILDDIASHQRSLFVKLGLGYEKHQQTFEEDARSKSLEKKIEEKPKIYANVLQISNHSEENNRKRNHKHQRTNLRRHAP